MIELLNNFHGLVEAIAMRQHVCGRGTEQQGGD